MSKLFVISLLFFSFVGGMLFQFLFAGTPAAFHISQTIEDACFKQDSTGEWVVNWDICKQIPMSGKTTFYKPVSAAAWEAYGEMVQKEFVGWEIERLGLLDEIKKLQNKESYSRPHFLPRKK